MAEERFLITGALGCIGAWAIRNLIHDDIPVAILDVGKRYHRLKLLLSDEEINRIKVFADDISDLSNVISALESYKATHIIHLAALQLPFCKADPPRGAQVNVTGTVNIFEAAKRLGIRHIAYASSTAVYGISEEYPEGPLANDAPLLPRSHYGVFKQANEGTARVYWLNDNVPSIGLRPYVVYGAGRDQGMTSTPTKAMISAVISKPYHISYGGRYCFQYGDDVGKIFIQAARAEINDAKVFNLGGASVSTEAVISCIENAVPAMRGAFTFDPTPLPFPENVDNSELIKILGQIPSTPLQVGVDETIQIFRNALAEDKTNLDELKIMIDQ